MGYLKEKNSFKVPNYSKYAIRYLHHKWNNLNKAQYGYCYLLIHSYKIFIICVNDQIVFEQDSYFENKDLANNCNNTIDIFTRILYRRKPKQQVR